MGSILGFGVVVSDVISKVIVHISAPYLQLPRNLQADLGHVGEFRGFWVLPRLAQAPNDYVLIRALVS